MKKIVCSLIFILFISKVYGNETKTVLEFQASETISNEDIYDIFYLKSLSALNTAKHYTVIYEVYQESDRQNYSARLVIRDYFDDSKKYICTEIRYSFGNGYFQIVVSDHGFKFTNKSMDSTEIITFSPGTADRVEICEIINLNLRTAYKESTLFAKNNGATSKFVINDLFK